MTKYDQSVWVCDRCEKDDILKQGKRPIMWAEATVRYLSPDSEPGPTIHGGNLCDECVEAFRKWWKNG